MEYEVNAGDPLTRKSTTFSYLSYLNRKKGNRVAVYRDKFDGENVGSCLKVLTEIPLELEELLG